MRGTFRNMLVLAVTAIFLAVSTARAGDTCASCLKELDRRLETLSRSCDPAAKAMLAVAEAYQEVKSAYDAARTRRQKYAAEAERLKKTFADITKQYKELRLEAARQGLLLPDALARAAYGGGGGAKSAANGIFGIPVAAYTFDPARIAKVRQIGEREKRLRLDWDKAAEEYRKASSRLRDEFNQWAAKEGARFAARYKTLQGLRETLVYDFYKTGTYAHCLGEFSWDRVEKLPTFAAWFDHDKAKSVFQPVPAFPTPPDAVRALPVLPMYLDGRLALKSQLAILKTEIETQGVHSRIKLLQAAYLTVKTVRDTTAGFLKGLFYDLPKMAVSPLGNLFDAKQGWLESLGNTAYGYGKAGKALTWDAAAGLLRDARDMITSAADLSGKVVSAIASADKQRAWQSVVAINRFALATVQSLQRFFDDARRQGKPHGIPEDLEGVAQLKTVLQGMERINDSIDSAVKGYETYVLENAKRAFNLATSAGMAKGVANALNTRLRGVFKQASQASESLAGHIEQARSISYLQAKASVTRKPIRLPETVRKGDLEHVAQRLRQGEHGSLALTQRRGAPERGAAGKKEIGITRKKSLREGTARQQAVAAAGTGPGGRTFTTADGKIIQVTRQLGEGSSKVAYEFVENGQPMVIKIFKGMSREEIKLEINRMGETARRLKKAGLGYQKYRVVKLKDGSLAVVERKFDTSHLAENVLDVKALKEGRTPKPSWTDAHTKAYYDLVTHLNKKGYILTDPNFGNIRFVKDTAGRLKAELIDLDGVVSVKEVIKEKGAAVEIAGDAFRLDEAAGVVALQKKILFGFNPKNPALGGINEYIAAEIGKALATSKYTLAKESFVPTSTGAAGHFWAKILGKEQYLKMASAFDDAARNVGTSRFFKQMAKETLVGDVDVPADGFLEGLNQNLAQIELSDLPRIENLDLSALL